MLQTPISTAPLSRVRHLKILSLKSSNAELSQILSGLPHHFVSKALKPFLMEKEKKGYRCIRMKLFYTFCGCSLA